MWVWHNLHVKEGGNQDSLGFRSLKTHLEVQPNTDVIVSNHITIMYRIEYYMAAQSNMKPRSFNLIMNSIYIFVLLLLITSPHQPKRASSVVRAYILYSVFYIYVCLGVSICGREY